MTNKDFSFSVSFTDSSSRARLGKITTHHGNIITPAFVPVGTQGSIKSLTTHEAEQIGTELFFVNTYHIYLRPGEKIVEKAGGLHKFINSSCPIITDSGGFQVFSLGAKKTRKDELTSDRTSLVSIDDDGVTFQSHWDGSSHRFSAESSIKTQHLLGADIIIAFDDCTFYPATHEQVEKSMKRTHEWALRSLSCHQSLGSSYGFMQALYGVVQGGVYDDLRSSSAQYIASLPFDGICIGGVSVGESKKEMVKVLRTTVPYLPEDKPRHLLGVGEIDDVFEAIEHGMDTFDCVQPTRLARMGRVYTKIPEKLRREDLTLDLMNKEFATDFKPIQDTCGCMTCMTYTRSYIHHLFRVRELLAYRLTTIHNIYFMHDLVKNIRTALLNETYQDCKQEYLST